MGDQAVTDSERIIGSQPAADRIAVCGLVPYPTGTTPSQRFRIEQWQSRLAEDGIAVDLLPFAGKKLLALLPQPGHLTAKLTRIACGFARRLWHLPSVARYDAVLIHRAAAIVGPAVLERMTRLLRRPIIFDFDDAIWKLHTAAVNRRLGWLKFPGKTATICRLSFHVVVGNEYLAEYARRHCDRVTIIPSSVDTDRFRPVPKPQTEGRVVVGWSGSSTSQTYLELFAPVVRELAALPGVELRIHSDRHPDLPGVPFVWRPWSPETEAAEIAAFDIGLMPMPDDQWSRGKCAMKALLYMAVGAVAVCSPVGANVELIRHGENGLLAATPDEWVECVRALVADADLRKRLGDAGRQTVVDGYSMTSCAARFAQVVREVVHRKSPTNRGQTDSVPATQKAGV